MSGQQSQQSCDDAWGTWCDHLLRGSTKAGIYTLDKTPCCVKPDLNISPTFLDEAEKVMSEGIENAKIFKLKLDGDNYFIIRADKTSLIAKCGQRGLTVAKSKSCYLIGAYDDSITPGKNSDAVIGTRDLMLDSEQGQVQQQQTQQQQTQQQQTQQHQQQQQQQSRQQQR